MLIYPCFHTTNTSQRKKAYANKIAVSTGGGSHYLKHTDNNSPEAVRDDRDPLESPVFLSSIHNRYPPSHVQFIISISNPPPQTPKQDQRKATLVYYLNPGWDSKSNGGQLRLYSRSGKQVRGWVVGLRGRVSDGGYPPTYLPSIH